MDARLPDDVTRFFTEEYLQRLQVILPDRVYRCYLYGSITLGAYDPAKSDLDFMTVLTHPLDDDEVRQEMTYNINGYWLGRAQQHRWKFLLDEEVELAVLTPCRILYTLEHRQIATKVEAGQWALQTLSTPWHLLVQEGLRIRTRKS